MDSPIRSFLLKILFSENGADRVVARKKSRGQTIDNSLPSRMLAGAEQITKYIDPGSKILPGIFATNIPFTRSMP
jgi:hypothetical protein